MYQYTLLTHTDNAPKSLDEKPRRPGRLCFWSFVWQGSRRSVRFEPNSVEEIPKIQRRRCLSCQLSRRTGSLPLRSWPSKVFFTSFCNWGNRTFTHTPTTRRSNRVVISKGSWKSHPSRPLFLSLNGSQRVSRGVPWVRTSVLAHTYRLPPDELEPYTIKGFTSPWNPGPSLPYPSWPILHDIVRLPRAPKGPYTYFSMSKSGT